MKVAFFSIVLNIHQARVADELYELTNHSFVFVELEKPEIIDNKGGNEDFSYRPYLLQMWKGGEYETKAMEVARNAEIAVFGGYLSLRFQIERLRENRLTFEMGERWLKHWQSLFSPRLNQNIWSHHMLRWRQKPLYKLCASAYAANDQYLFHTFRDRCYKWGYFTKVEDQNIDSIISQREATSPCLMWCARFLSWKHPELVIKLARRLKDSGYDVRIDMYGAGVELDATRALSKRLGVQDSVCFRGSANNDEILKEMRRHDIFLFTSDRNEGWGAVLNEAMGNGCAVVASEDIGSVPFLIIEDDNGLVFKPKDLDSLFEKVVYLLDNPTKRIEMSHKAYQTMYELWSPRNAAINFMRLANSLRSGGDTPLHEGPCSKAYPHTYCNRDE